MKNGAHTQIEKGIKWKHIVSFFKFSLVFFVIDDACVLKILKHTMTDEDDVISTRIQASIDFPVNKKNTIKFCCNVLSRICHFMARSNEEGNLCFLYFFLLIT